MKEIGRLYHRSMVSTSKKVSGFLINKDINEAFDLYCSLKNVSKSSMIETLISMELVKYLCRYNKLKEE